MASSKTIEDYLAKNHSRLAELEKLRETLLSHEFEESIKWGMPSYGLDGKNLVGIGSFKNWSCLWFHQGCFLSDKANKLVNAQEGKTSGMRQWRFLTIDDIDENLVSKYLLETIQNHKEGKSIVIAKKAKKQVEIPDLIKTFLEDHIELKEKFKSYTVSQKNEFSTYIIEAKRASTKAQRLEKIKGLISEGKTLSSIWGG